MIPELGHYALVIALCLALVQGVLPLLGAQLGQGGWMAVARPTAVGQFAFMGIALVCLGYAFVHNDFSVLYVAKNSNTELPLMYRISAIWGAHEGSLLLWGFILATWTVAVAAFSRSMPRPITARVIAVMGLVSVGFLLFMLLTSNPFERVFPPPTEGKDLNPLLQDPGLAIHPPMLYMGYVGFSVAFAFAIAALLGGRIDAAWARWSRPWTTVAWLFLTIGITLGSWWAYNELGWGGWWFWDPVENASFMPWLVGTALIHSLAVTDKRGAFKNWTLLLAIFAFSLSLLGTFLVRSGVLVSVHAFATDPARGVFILAFLAVVIGASLTLYAWRAPRMEGGGGFALFSRESLLLVNNLLLVVAAITVLLGTLYPLFMDALNLGKISVGPPYFDSVFVPLMLPLLLAMGLGPLARWKKASLREVARELRWVAVVALAVGIATPLLVMGEASVATLAGTVFGLWAALTALYALWSRVRAKAQPVRGLMKTPRHVYGMVFAHIGVGIFAIGVTFTSAYGIERDVKLSPGEAINVRGHEFRFQGVDRVQGPNYEASRGDVVVTREGRTIAQLAPEKRTYRSQAKPMTEASIDIGPFRDLYVSLGEPLGGGAWSVRIYHKPLVRWIWTGGLLMALGGLLAATDRRYRVGARAREQMTAAERTAVAQS